MIAPPAVAGEAVLGGMMDDKPRRRLHPVYLILLLPYIAFASVPFYDRIEPQLFGIPFFYWWQMVWIPLTAICIVPVYRHQEGGK